MILSVIDMCIQRKIESGKITNFSCTADSRSRSRALHRTSSRVWAPRRPTPVSGDRCRAQCQPSYHQNPSRSSPRSPPASHLPAYPRGVSPKPAVPVPGTAVPRSRPLLVPVEFAGSIPPLGLFFLPARQLRPEPRQRRKVFGANEFVLCCKVDWMMLIVYFWCLKTCLTRSWGWCSSLLLTRSWWRSRRSSTAPGLSASWFCILSSDMSSSDGLDDSIGFWRQNWMG